MNTSSGSYGVDDFGGVGVVSAVLAEPVHKCDVMTLTVIEHDRYKFRGFGGAIDIHVREPMRQRGKPSKMIRVSVGENDGVNMLDATDVGCDLFEVTAANLDSAVDEHGVVAELKEVRASADFVGATKWREL